MPWQARAISRTDSSAARDERRPQQEILRRIAGDRELGQEDDVRLLRARIGESSENALAVALQVTDDRVDLGESKPHRDNSTGLRLSGENTEFD